MNSRFFRIIKMSAKVTGLALLCFFILAALTGLFYGKEIKQLMIGQLNKNLAAEIQVKDFDFSVWRHFPYASVELNDVLVHEVTENVSKDTLLYADHLTLLFNLMGVFKKDVTVRKINLKNGYVNIRVDEAGKGNYHFWKSNPDSGSSSAIDLEKIVLSNIRMRYLDKHNAQDYLFTAKDASLTGKFSKEQFSLGTKAGLFIEHFYVHGVNYVDHKEAVIKSGLMVDSKTDHYQFEKSSVQIAGLLLDVGGDLTVLEHTTSLHLAINSHEADLADFISLLPPAYVTYFKDFKNRGRLIVSTTIQGNAGGKQNPEVKVLFEIKNGSVESKDSPVSLEALNLSGSFQNKSGGKNQLLIPSLTGKIGGRIVKADLRLDDLQNPFLTLHAAGSLDLAQLRHFIKKDTLSSLDGDLSFNIAFAGKIRDLPRVYSDEQYQVKASGTVDLKDVNLMLKHNPLEFKNFSGNLALHDNDIEVHSLKGNLSSSDFQVSGVFRNFINFLLIPGQPANIDAKVISREVDLDEILANKSTTTQDDTTYILKINPRLVSDLDVSIGEMKFRKFRADKMTGKIHVEKQVISGKGVSFSSMDGTTVMDAIINGSRKDSVLMSCDARINRIDVNQLFSQMENFGQTTMTDQNVRGKLTAAVQFTSTWSKDLVINPSRARSTCDITIENGELLNFRPVQAIAKYIKLPDLNHIRFSTLKNLISISDRKISIPTMEIKSSALNLSASGTHDFDNIVDYHLKLLFSEILGKKVKQNNSQSEFGEIEDDGLGRTQLLLTMQGPVDNPKFAYDRKAAREKIRDDLARDKQNIRGILKEEFGMYRKDTVKTVKNKKKDELQIDWGNTERP